MCHVDDHYLRDTLRDSINLISIIAPSPYFFFIVVSQPRSSTLWHKCPVLNDWIINVYNVLILRPGDIYFHIKTLGFGQYDRTYK